MSYLERLQAKAAMRAVEEPAKGSKGAFAPFEGDRTGQVGKLSDDLSGGLERLRTMPAPRIVKADVWTRVVRDALAIGDAGWAAKAMALDWSALDLFGAVTDPMGDPYSDGLAVWLSGRELRAISATMASVKEGEGWAWFNRREQVGARLLWELNDGA